MIGKQCVVSGGQVQSALNGIANALCGASLFCSKVLSQNVKLPFGWNDAIHLCQSAEPGAPAAPSALSPRLHQLHSPKSSRMAPQNLVCRL